jgi:tRNA/tmRNA/rRNA uracil-C5-methylase (TrmA/RlmC/RlmD family)
MTDWTALRTEFVHSSDNLLELAERHGLNKSTVRNRAQRERWQAERDSLRLIATQRADNAIIEVRADELSQFNLRDLEVAKMLKNKAEAMSKSVDKPSDLRALALAFESAQKIGRLALGATTENNGVSGSINTTSVTPKELAEAVERVRDTY